MPGDAVGRSGGGFLAPFEVVRIGTDEMDSAMRANDLRPELFELADSEPLAFAEVRPGIAEPLLHKHLLNFDFIVIFVQSVERLLRAGAGIGAGHENASFAFDF